MKYKLSYSKNVRGMLRGVSLGHEETLKAAVDKANSLTRSQGFPAISIRGTGATYSVYKGKVRKYVDGKEVKFDKAELENDS